MPAWAAPNMICRTLPGTTWGSHLVAVFQSVFPDGPVQVLGEALEDRPELPVMDDPRQGSCRGPQALGCSTCAHRGRLVGRRLRSGALARRGSPVLDGSRPGGGPRPSPLGHREVGWVPPTARWPAPPRSAAPPGWIPSTVSPGLGRVHTSLHPGQHPSRLARCGYSRGP